ncbi:hypothetical protein BJX99DRAFT_250918 [Aspergillus californicus]
MQIVIAMPTESAEPTEGTRVRQTNSIDNYSAHWHTTLLGADFWRDAERWNQQTNDRIEADHVQSLHTRFPFNIGFEQILCAPSVSTTTADDDEEEEEYEDEEEEEEEIIEVTVPEKRSRRFSMSDALGLSSITERSSSLLGRHSRSGSRAGRARSSSVTPDIRRSNSMIRSTLSMMTGRKKIHEEDKDDDQDDQDDKTEYEPVVIIPTFTPDQATPTNPVMEFHGGPLWSALPKDRKTLGIDVFWPILLNQDSSEKENVPPKVIPYPRVSELKGVKAKPDGEEEEEDPPTMFPVAEMGPLCTFRNLRILKITGMMQSYQLDIFQAAWLNTNLEELELGMALPPRLRRGYTWPFIKGGWTLDKSTYGEPVYYGSGYGTLTPSVGSSAYLDKICLEKAKIRAMAVGSTRNRLSIRTLILSGVVVDADPFLHWFDPTRLKCINFKDDCVDAGFYLPHCMQRISVLFPREIHLPRACLRGRMIDLKPELKVVEIRGGKKVKEEAYQGRESLSEDTVGGVGEGKKDETKDLEKGDVKDQVQVILSTL